MSTFTGIIHHNGKRAAYSIELTNARYYTAELKSKDILPADFPEKISIDKYTLDRSAISDKDPVTRKIAQAIQKAEYGNEDPTL